ncbi:Xaa-Pro dipeptidase [Alginatibacterium sediminis]|uniref:Xaa-Pro dipeptidase n=1 Tax=Alginatibacterium sediminis TaxID=2164068 RepID=A0A420ENK0_9ALTE|nr:Xaa-Pro dipeptidase [Alginatibacterium sediminis]RKF22299.1 Xaa-Pro dipeptidase [Alginatibacterium sediminis]
MPDLNQIFAQHIQVLQSRTQDVLAHNNLEALIIHSGFAPKIFLDDQDYPFKCNPHFKHWLPLTQHAHCWLVVNGVDKPKLIYHLAQDYWHAKQDLPDVAWLEQFEVSILANPQDIEPLLPDNRQQCAYIGDHPELAEALAIGERNPESVLNYLHFYRAEKTDYELDCIVKANKSAVKGHLAAKEAFFAGGSEFEIHLAYLQAVGCVDQDLPYSNIIALNEHAATLHYTQLQKQGIPDKQRYSMLIDAGAQYHGYAADISRTYAFRKSLFSDLILAMEQLQATLIESIKIGQCFIDLHAKAHHLLAHILVDFDLVNCSVPCCVEKGISRVFFPHGLGHFLGLQVHDVGGFMRSHDGEVKAAPDSDPALRFTRMVGAKQVLTIEPGLYFIASLLDELANSDASSLVNWEKIDLLRRFGGIRIEDNIYIGESSVTNISREINWSS